MIHTLGCYPLTLMWILLHRRLVFSKRTAHGCSQLDGELIGLRLYTGPMYEKYNTVWPTCLDQVGNLYSKELMDCYGADTHVLQTPLFQTPTIPNSVNTVILVNCHFATLLILHRLCYIR